MTDEGTVEGVSTQIRASLLAIPDFVWVRKIVTLALLRVLTDVAEVAWFAGRFGGESSNVPNRSLTLLRDLV